jgi:hypothetical protein
MQGPKINQLLSQVAIKITTLQEARNRFASQLAFDFCIFDYLRADEMGISGCIASLLDPRGTHGQGRIFLDAFLKLTGSSWATTAEDCEVSLEKQANGKRRIDVYLNFPNIGIIGIENKPWASDKEDQLIDYAKFIRKEAGNKKWLLIYLCNRDPDEVSINPDARNKFEESKQFLRIDYADVIGWLEYCASQSKALVVRVFIVELAKFIRININEELDMSEESEIAGLILESKSSIRSAFHISKGLDAVKKELIIKFKNEFEAHIGKYGYDLIWDKGMNHDGRRNVGFGVKFDKIQDKYLRFEFDSIRLNSLGWGIRRENEFVECDEGIWTSVENLMKSKFRNGKKYYPWWPWHSTIPDDEFTKEFNNWDAGEVPWISINDGSLSEKITKLVIRVHDTFRDANKLNLLLKNSGGIHANSID